MSAVVTDFNLRLAALVMVECNIMFFLDSLITGGCWKWGCYVFV